MLCGNLRKSVVLLQACSRMVSTGSKRLDGKVAIVTGSTEGIGFAIAKGLAENGAKVVVSSRKQENVTKAVSLLQDMKLEVCGTICHVGNAEDRRNLVELAIKEYGQLDIMVSNAGINPVAGPILNTSEEAWDKIFNINVKSGFLLAKECAPYLTETRGSMLFVSSIVGYTPFSKLGPYSVSKTALIGLIKVLSQELVSRGIRVNGIAPGIIKTDFSTMLTETEHLSKRIMAMVPMKRFGTADECAGTAVFLSSDDASYISGEIIGINGGMISRL